MGVDAVHDLPPPFTRFLLKQGSAKLYDYWRHDARRRGLHIVRDDFLCFAAKVISHLFRRSSFQKQNRTAASCLVDNFGPPLCWVLFLAGRTRSVITTRAKKQPPCGAAAFLWIDLPLLRRLPGGTLPGAGAVGLDGQDARAVDLTVPAQFSPADKNAVVALVAVVDAAALKAQV